MSYRVPFCKPQIGPEEIEAATRVMQSGWVVAGKETEVFEKEFADYVGVKYAIFTNSCTAALKMAYKWAKKRGAVSIWYPNNTFCATYSAAKETGLATEPYEDVCGYCDNSTPRVNVAYGGVKDETPCLIEDSAHRIEPNDPLVGKIRCYSFYATKNMTTIQGGMFVTNDKEVYETARLWWKDGLSTSTADRVAGSVGYEVLAMAGGYDSNDVLAAIGRVQLKKLPEFNRRRNKIRDQYNQALNQDWQGNHLYPFFVKTEEDVQRLVNHLKDCGIQASYHYPNTGWLGVSLPLYPSLTDEQVQEVIDAVRSFK